MKLKHDELLSNFAFNFNLRHYSKDDASFNPLLDPNYPALQLALAQAVERDPEVGRCSLIDHFAHLTPRLLSALETDIDQPVSNFAFNCNPRPSIKIISVYMQGSKNMVGRCRLTLGFRS